jgi:hypothetical protein
MTFLLFDDDDDDDDDDDSTSGIYSNIHMPVKAHSDRRRDAPTSSGRQSRSWAGAPALGCSARTEDLSASTPDVMRSATIVVAMFVLVSAVVVSITHASAVVAPREDRQKSDHDPSRVEASVRRQVRSHDEHPGYDRARDQSRGGLPYPFG